MTEIETLTSEVEKIKLRNKKVTVDKMWETSWTRRMAIAVLTYFVVCIFFVTIGVERPFVNAIVPVLGFMASTLSLQALKQWWIERHRLH